MLVFIFGGSASGKSAYAQEVIRELAGQMRKDAEATLQADASRITYLATMENDGAEAMARIKAHRRLREGMGFETLECPRLVGNVIGGCAPYVLLEAVSNLLANEMFGGDGEIAPEEAAGRVYSDICALHAAVKGLVVVSDDVFSDGNTYDKLTEAYRAALGRLHRRLAAEADVVTEVICGIPRIRKGDGEWKL